MNTLNTTDNLKQMVELGADWWNDSCDLSQLAEAVSNGATGATSNPVIVEAAVNADKERWLNFVKETALQFPSASTEELTWKLIAEMGRKAAEILYPVYSATNGAKGYLSLQVNPKHNLDENKMYRQATELASIAPNIAIKLPSTETGLAVAERLVANGISVNTTVSFSVAQAVAAAEAIERGLIAYESNGNDRSKLHPYVTIMIGRVGDYLSRIATREGIEIDDNETIARSGVFVFKNAARIFRERGYQSTLLAAAYRHEMQWSQIIGKDVLQSIPYTWWQKFRTSEVDVRETIQEPEDETALQSLRSSFPDFEKVYLEDGLAIENFQTFEPSSHTLDQFILGYNKLEELVDKTIS